jgi:hypothetical protein
MRTCRCAVLLGFLGAGVPAFAGVDDFHYNNATPNNLMAMASRPDAGGKTEIEAADDFITPAEVSVDTASFWGVLTSTVAPATVQNVTVEIYRVFPKDSDTVRLIQVPTRANSPSDVAFTSRDAGSATLAFSTTTLAASFTANNSVLTGIHPSPNQTTNGEGPITGTEVRFDVTFTSPLDLPADHYFFVPQVQVSSGEFYWLSGSRPISGAGTTPLSPDLQAWIRNDALAPDWLRVGTDIVGGQTPPTFNGAFTLDGATVPEPSSLLLLAAGAVGLLRGRRIQGR